MGQIEEGQECERVRSTWCRSVKGSAGSGLRVEGVNRKRDKRVGDQQEMWQECEEVRRKWGRSVSGLAGSEVEV